MILKLLILLLLVSNQIHGTPKKSISNLTAPDEIKETTSKNTITQKEQQIGSIEIPILNIYNDLYSPNSKHNNIEENVTILRAENEPQNKSSLIILAAHSGQGKTAYFNNLNKLELNDEIIFTYYNKKYIYKVINIFEQEKTGYINISKKDTSQLILTTCSISNKNKQLIIESILKEP